MLTNEKIAHDLTIIYLSNRYGINVIGNITDGDGHIKTEHLPGVDEKKYIKVGTDEKGLFGIEKKEKIEDGYKIDDLFVEILEEYRIAYTRFLALLERN